MDGTAFDTYVETQLAPHLWRWRRLRRFAGCRWFKESRSRRSAAISQGGAQGAAFGRDGEIVPGFLNNIVNATSDDLPTNINGMRSFVRACTYSRLPPDVLETAICWNVTVPARIRAAFVAREIDPDELLAALTVPVLMSQGEEDHVVGLSESPRVLVLKDGARTLLKNSDRFNAELSDFAHDANVCAVSPGDRATFIRANLILALKRPLNSDGRFFGARRVGFPMHDMGWFPARRP